MGMVLRAPTGGGPQQYVVLPEQVVPVSDFTARLLLGSRALDFLGQAGEPLDVGAASFVPSSAEAAPDHGLDWPAEPVTQVNVGARDTICSVLLSVDGDGGTEQATWAGDAYPATIASGATSAYVTPGTGLLYRQVVGEQAEAGGVFLATDTGLRYAVQATATGEEADQAQLRLGYGDISPVPVPASWSTLLPTGPRLDTDSAKQPQGS